MRRMPSAASIGSMPERLRDLLGQRLLRGREIERHLAAEEAVGAEPAEDEIGVGDGRLGAAEAVADRAGRRARAFRTHPQGVADLDAGDAAAAGADLLDVDHRHLHGQPRGIAADQRRAGHQHGALVDHAGLGGGAAHVERDGVGEADRVAQHLGADDARGRSRFQHADAGAPRVVHVEQPAGRLHDQEVAAEARVAEMRLHLGEIGLHARADIGVGRGGRGALVLAVLLAELVRGGDEQLREFLLHDLLRADLVRRVAVGVQEQDGDRLHAGRDRLARDPAHLLLVERDQHRALRVHPLHDLEAHVAVDQRRVLLEEQVVGLRPVDAADLVDVAEALRGQQRAARALALQDGVDGDRGAVQEQPRGVEARCRPCRRRSRCR